MATLRTKTVYFAFDTHTANVATNTTLGTATRHDFTAGGGAMTLDIPETGSRTFLSVRPIIAFRDAITTAGREITGIRMGMKLAAVAFTDVDRSFTQADTGDHFFDEWDYDFTDYFNTNFGAGASQTCQVGLAVSTDVAEAIGGGITCLLEVTYQYDDDSGTTRVKSIPIPLGSHHTFLSTTQQEIGVGGTGPTPANQIPILDTYLEEASVSIKRSWIQVDCNDTNSTGTTDVTPYIQIDAVAETAGGVIEQALTTAMPFRWLFPYATGTYSTAAVHAFKMRADVDQRLQFANGVLWVTYTYNKSTSTRVLNVVDVPMTDSISDNEGWRNTLSHTDAVEADGPTRYAIFDIQEPGLLKIKQSCAYISGYISSNGGNWIVSAGQQPVRTYTPLASTNSDNTIVHRTDHTFGWSLGRGENRLPLKAYGTLSTRSTMQVRAIVVYSSDVPAGGTEVGNHVVNFFTSTFGTTLAVTFDYAKSGAGIRHPVLVGPYKINSVMLDARKRLTPQSRETRIGCDVQAGELDDKTIFVFNTSISDGAPNEQFVNRLWYSCTRAFDRDTGHTGMLNIETPRRWIATEPQAGLYLFSWSTRITYHQIVCAVAGTARIDGATVANGKAVRVYAENDRGNVNDAAEFVGEAVTAGGAGAFTFSAFDNTRKYFATYDNDNRYGRSPSGRPATAVADAPFVCRRGAEATGTGSVTVDWPNHRKGDIGVLIIESGGSEAAALSPDAGFVAIADSPQDKGNNSTGTRLTMYWCRATSRNMASPTVTDPGDHVIARIITIRGCIETGDPWDVTSGGTANTSTSVSITGDTTTVDRCLVLLVVCNSTDGAAGTIQATAFANADLFALADVVASQTANGAGGGFGVAAGVKKVAGAYAATTATLLTTSEQAFMSVAFKPPAAPNTSFDVTMFTSGPAGGSSAGYPSTAQMYQGVSA